MEGRGQQETQELATGQTAVIAVGLSSVERSLLGAFEEAVEAATGTRFLPASTVDGGLARLSVLRGRGVASLALVSSSVGSREALRLLRWMAPPTGLAPVVFLCVRGDEALLSEALAARACDALMTHELDVDRIARMVRLAAELARRDLADELVRHRIKTIESQLDTVWDTVDEALLLVDEDRRVVRSNAAAERLFGLPGAELQSAPFRALGWAAAEPDYGGVAQLSAAEISAEIERPDGDRRRVGLKVRTLGRRAGSRDRERLVSIRERTDAGDHELLSAEARHFAGLGRFLAGAAHDCSNLLTPLLGYCELLLTKVPPDSAAAGYALEIERSARLAAELVHRLRDTARNRPILESTVAPDRCLIDLAGLLRSLVGRGIELTEDLRGGELRVSMRSGEIEQIVLNLAANARDSMPLGGRLALRSRCAGDNRWVLEIEDSGGGIAPENLGRVFDPAFTTKAVGKGTGLGLWIVRSIVEQAGGSVIVLSALGKGTTVRVELPAERDDVDSPPTLRRS